MSGGSLDYISGRVDDAAYTIMGRYPKDAQLQAFGKLMLNASRALHAIEWELSGDSSLTKEDREMIDSIIGPSAELKELVEEAKDINERLAKKLEKMSE